MSQFRLLLPVLAVSALVVSPAIAAGQAPDGSATLAAVDVPAPVGEPAPLSAPGLSLELATVPTGKIERNRERAYRIRVHNTGTATARNIRVRVAGVRGLSVRPRTVTVKALGAGRSTERRVRVRLTKRARRSTPVRFTATADEKLRARHSHTLRIGTPPLLAGRAFWRNQTRANRGWDIRVLAFQDRYLLRNVPEGGPVECKSETTSGTDDGKTGCLRYSADRRKRTVRYGGTTGRLKGRTLTHGDSSYRELAYARPGQLFELKLSYRNFSGLCGLITGCRTVHDELVLQKNGRFVLSSSSITTIGGHGAPFVAAGNYPPDEQGRYEVLSGNRMRLTYDDGTTKTHAFYIDRDEKGRPDAAGEGVFLDDRIFLPPED